MAKGSNGRKSNKKTPQKSLPALSDSDMDDEIDVFHKQRDVVPLDLDDDMANSDEDNDQHVFEIESGSDDDEDDDDFDDEDDSEEDTGFAAKIAKQQKSLKAKIGGAADETQDDAEDEEKKSAAWGRSKNIYYDTKTGASSEEDEEEEEEVQRLLAEKTKAYSNADLGLEEDSEEEPTFENLIKGKSRSKASIGDDVQLQDEADTEVVMKDPSALSKDEQMDIVYNSAPELVGLLSELNEAVDQLETKVDPILNKLKEEKNMNKNGVQYMEVKKQLLLSYCQAIAFHLLLKSEGHSVHDHPVLARIVEIKNLLDKMKSLDENLSFDIEDFLKNYATTKMADSPMEIAAVDFVSSINNSNTTEPQKAAVVGPKTDSTKDRDNGGKRKRESEKIGLQSVEMLKVRAALEEKLKQKGVFNLKATKTEGAKKNPKPLNGKLEARDDFDDDAFDIGGNQYESSNRLSHLVTQTKKPRVTSGDDDLPKRDDIGERRRKFETRVLANAGIQSEDDFQENDHNTPGEAEDGETSSESDSESDLYKQTEIKRNAKLAAKSQKYSRTAPSVLETPETQLDGKRHINYEIEKNRGLTRKRNKDLKNPRKKYKVKHQKKVVARKGQVRDTRKVTGPYGGEVSGINNSISRSIRFKS